MTGEEEMKILHFSICNNAGAVRLQRYLLSNTKLGIENVALVPSYALKDDQFSGNKALYYPKSRTLGYMLPLLKDFGLKKLFKRYRFDLVHAHDLPSAYYAHQLKLPLVYDDWEYYLEYWNYSKPRLQGSLPSLLVVKKFLLRRRDSKVKGTLEKLLTETPTIVTNEAVAERYTELGGQLLWVVPNVPLKAEVDYAMSFKVDKNQTLTTCYIGSLSKDEASILRCTQGVRSLWKRSSMGNLYIFEGPNKVPHLEVMPKVRECHFNLLYWKPLPIHKFYLQNKAFLASAIRVPTVISSSLTSTIALLKDYALVVERLEEIPDILRTHDPLSHQKVYEEHLWDYYESRILEAYEKCLDP